MTTHSTTSVIDHDTISVAAPFDPFRERTRMREAFGLADDQLFVLDVLIDRSGSVSDSDALAQQRMARMIAAIEDDTTRVLLTGYHGGEDAQMFPYKTHSGHDILDTLPRDGGGGTPTGDAVAWSAGRLAAEFPADAFKAIVVVTDGASARIDDCADTIAQVRAGGVRIVGAGYACAHPYLPVLMAQQFGNTFIMVDRYEDVVERLIMFLGHGSAFEEITPRDTSKLDAAVVAVAAALDTDERREFVTAHATSGSVRLRELAARLASM